MFRLGVFGGCAPPVSRQAHAEQVLAKGRQRDLIQEEGAAVETRVEQQAPAERGMNSGVNGA